MRFFEYKCNDTDGSPTGSHGDWLMDFFAYGGVCEWGGTHSTTSPESANLISYDVWPGDVITCYQTDFWSNTGAIVGFAKVTDKVLSKRSHVFKNLVGYELMLEPLAIVAPLAIHHVKHGTILEHSPAINGPPMLRELTLHEMQEIVRLTGAPRRVLKGK